MSSSRPVPSDRESARNDARAAIQAYAEALAGTELDLDAELERAGLEVLVSDLRGVDPPRG